MCVNVTRDEMLVSKSASESRLIFRFFFLFSFPSLWFAPLIELFPILVGTGEEVGLKKRKNK